MRHSEPFQIMSRYYDDVDRDAERQKRLQQINYQRQLLDEQNSQPQAQQKKFLDGRMSDEEYDKYEQSSLSYFKNALLNRIKRNPKQVSSFDMMQAEEFAQEDSQFAQELKNALNPPEPLRSNAQPAQQQQYQQYEPQQGDVILSVDPLPQSPPLNMMNQQFNPAPQPQVQYNQVDLSNTQLQPSSNGFIAQLPEPMHGSFIPAMQMMMQQFNFQQQQLINQIQQPNQQIMMMLTQLLNKPDRDDTHIQQQIQNLQNQLYNINRRLDQQEMENRIKGLQEQNEQLNKQLQQNNRQFQQIPQSIDPMPYVPSTQPAGKGRLSLKEIEERNRARAAAVAMLDGQPKEGWKQE